MLKNEPLLPCVHKLFERSVTNAKDALALRFRQDSFTFNQLNRISNGIAWMLHERGVGPETVVGIFGEKAPELVVALLGILKAGGAYAYLDHREPGGRASRAIADAGIKILLRNGNQTLPFSTNGIDEILLGSIGSMPENVDSFSAPIAPTLANLACVVFTSGSSGKPKGVALTHSALVARLTAPALSGIEPSLQKTSLGLVGHITDLLRPLISGLPVVMLDEEDSRNPKAIADSLREHHLTRLYLVPSMLRIFIECAESQGVAHQLRTIIVAGESISRDLVISTHRRFPNAVLINAYGTTETTGMVCSGRISDTSEISVGRPYVPEAIQIVTSELAPVKNTEIGEIAVLGATLARGYLSAPALDASHFTTHLVGREGARAYLTGDLGRYLADGTIQLLGRKNLEIKLHGMRVNIEDVEQTLERIPGIDRAVVALDETKPDHRQLRAYLTLMDSNSPMTSRDLRRQAQELLPEHMIPVSFAIVDTIRELPNGKLDRQHIASNAPPPLVTGSDEWKPKTVTEALLDQIWKREFGVGPHDDDFFSLGGDSLTATRLALHVSSVFNIELTIQDVFEHPTPAELAKAIDRLQITNPH
jgi:amino acid adenylation domain-containing protein